MPSFKDNRSEKKHYCRTLTIAGSDSGGGAGIQADLKTFSALGCFGMSVITALTAQNTTGVTGIHPIPPDFVEEQIDAVFKDIGTDSVKIGMLYSIELVETVCRTLKRYNPANIVLDPVIAAQSGDRLIQDDTIQAIKNRLMPLADVVTPNLPEAEIILNRPIKNYDEICSGAKDLAEYGCKSVLIKGGHGSGAESVDILFHTRENRIIKLSGKRIVTKNNHGTGCTLSSAIAANLAKGLSIEEAVKNAKKYIENAIKAGADYEIGKGCGPVHHFHKFWR